MTASSALTALADLLLPTPCAGCGALGVPWCGPCRERFTHPRVRTMPGLPPVVVLAPYAGPARAAVLAYKERGRRDLARPFAALVGTALADVGAPAAAIVPAPSRPSAARARGGDHVLRVARAVVARSRAGPGAPVVARALALGAGALDSVGLDPAARTANLARHLRLRPRGLPPPGRPVLLLDDVLTTGATARTATSLLAAVGRRPHAVVVLTAVRGTSPERRRCPRRGASQRGEMDDRASSAR